MTNVAFTLEDPRCHDCSIWGKQLNVIDIFEIHSGEMFVSENKTGKFHLFHPSVHSVPPVEDVQRKTNRQKDEKKSRGPKG